MLQYPAFAGLSMDYVALGVSILPHSSHINVWPYPQVLDMKADTDWTVVILPHWTVLIDGWKAGDNGAVGGMALGDYALTHDMTEWVFAMVILRLDNFCRFLYHRYRGVNMPEQGSSINFQEILLTRERELLLWAIEQAAGIHVEAAILLRMSYRSFRHYLGKHRLGSRGSIEWVNAHAQETKAVALLNRAIAEGSIKRPSQCSACGSTRRIEGHHTDYNKPLEVVWLCPSCHKLEHAKIAQKRRIVTRSAHGV